MQLRALKGCEFYDLFHLMQKEDFPDTPEHFYEAKEFLEKCLCYGKFSDQGQLQAAFIFGDITNESAFIDVICPEKYRGKWATKRTVRWIVHTAFKDIDLDYIWVNPKRQASMKLAIALGFQHVHGLDQKSPVTMVLSKQNKMINKFLN